MAYRKQAEEGNRLFQSILGKWFLEQGHVAEALKWLMPLSDSGFKVEQAIAEAWELLARTDPQHEAEAEGWLRHIKARYPGTTAEWLIGRGRTAEVLEWLIPLAETGRHVELAADTLAQLARTDTQYEAEAEHWLRALGSGGMLRLAREMRSWPSGREAAAKELLVALAREGNGPAADELARWERSDPVAAIGWHCRAIDLGFTRNWHDLEEVLRELRPVTADDQSLAARARVALDTAQAVERAEAASPPRETQDCLRVAETMAVVVATTAVVPFVQNIASQAAGDVYAKAKQLFGRALRRSSQELTDRSTGPTIYVVGDSMANTWLELRGQPSDDALRKLGEADLETLAAPDPRGRTVTVRWDHGEWRRQVE
ncbi:hypothetical protein [Streptomyces murinus]|uniref:hypothetical protein n=1 Tax=Streptomyces murinus TaxID=33900 RepID=UPI002E13CF92|nr:hypothetical protein OG516_30875 [Streptomyces murinus]